MDTVAFAAAPVFSTRENTSRFHECTLNGIRREFSRVPEKRAVDFVTILFLVSASAGMCM